MHRRIFNVCIAVACLVIGLGAKAQDSLSGKKPEMADALRASGKIYVVVAVVITILAGLFIYVIRLDSKISGLEKASRQPGR
jgi:hypothetical protein